MSRFSAEKSIDDPIVIPKGGSIDLNIATEGDNNNRAHQTVAILSTKELGLDISYPISVRVSGKGKLTIPFKAIPELFLSDRVGKLSLELAVGGFGHTELEVPNETDESETEGEGYESETDVEYESETDVEYDSETDEDGSETESEEEVKVKKVEPAKSKRTPKEIIKNTEPLLIKISDNISIASKMHYPLEAAPKRFGVKPEIHHIFRPDPRQVNAAFASILVLFVVISTILFLLSAWTFFVGVDLANLGPAMKASGFAHAAFLVSIGAIELVFFKYYKGTSIFDTIKSLAIIAPASVYFGSRALREVKARRLTGK